MTETYFLWGNEDQEWFDNHYRNHKELFDLASRFSDVYTQMLISANVESEDQASTLIAALASRILGQYESVFATARLGMLAESRILCRSLLEATFKLLAIVQDNQLAETMINSQFREDKNTFNKIKQLHELGHAPLEGEENVQGLIELMDQRMEENPAQRMTARAWAQSANLEHDYLTQYSLLSSSTHTSIKDMQKIIDRDDKENQLTIHFGPQPSGYEVVFVAAVGNLSHVMCAYANHFGLEQCLEENQGLFDEFLSFADKADPSGTNR